MAGSREAAPEAARGGSADGARRGEGGAWCGRGWSTAQRGRTVGAGEGRARRAGGGPRLGEGAGWREGLLSPASPLIPAEGPPRLLGSHPPAVAWGCYGGSWVNAGDGAAGSGGGGGGVGPHNSSAKKTSTAAAQGGSGGRRGRGGPTAGGEV
ncbi:hypothetical protein PVAP13_8KG390830 [Panicum virgatum]|uniref:Uncharacterized protein n=1 Tax=Panicum virgatum TaxID=38727 RepID=A0A8T0PQG5_PANVG|nr:hypothetical protein PVAP13_8KG390830 [Panicum virgatum]